MRSIATVGQHQDRNQDRKTNRIAVTRAATQQLIEQLEGRRMMAVDPFSPKSHVIVTPTSSNVLDFRNGPLAKGGLGLVNLYKEYTQYLKKGGDRYDFQSSMANLYVTSGRDVLVTMQTNGKLDDLVAQVRESKGKLVYRSKSRGLVEAYVPIDRVDDIASTKGLLHIRPAVRPRVGSAGSVSNDAERSEKTEFVIPSFGVDGTGQTVGVISDSFGDGSVSIATGDLPAVNVLSDDVATNEGRAMLELVHDLAPGADLQFSAVGNTENTFANSIRDLREAGSTIIVDDISFATSPYFGEGITAKAINDVFDDGAVYLTHQRNTAFAGYSAAANWVPERDVDNPGLAVDFNPGSGIDTKLDIHIQKEGFLFLQWDNPYDGSVGDVSADVDFYLYRDGALIAKATDDNFATGVPLEILNVQERGDYEIVMRLHKLEKGATAPTMFKFSADGNEPDVFDSRVDVEYPGYNSSAVGHTMARGAIAVGAVNNADTNAFGEARNPVSEDFSSGGPVVRVFDPNGNRLPVPEVVLAPLLSGVDATATSVPGFEIFPGTSAAAPNVAGVVALLRELAPNASPEEIKDALVIGAKANPLNGAKAGEWDPQGGFGLVDAIKSASVLSPEIPVSEFNVATFNGNGSVSSVSVTFSEPVTGVDITDFILNRDGTNVNRFTGSEGFEASLDGLTFTITNLKSATSTLGVYTIILRNNRTDILDAESNVAAGNIVSFDVSLRKVSGLLADTLDDGKIRLRWNDSNGAEDSYRIQRATDSFFSENVRNIDVGADVTTYIDNDVLPGTQYFYRIRASKGGRLGDAAKVSIVSSSAGEIYVDDTLAKLVGNWSSDTDADAFLQTDAAASATAASGVNANVATFSSNDIASGNYLVYVRYTQDAGNATNATFQVMLDKKVIDAVKVDQTKRGGGWVVLGKYQSTGVGALSVRLNSAGASGPVNVDAVRFLPADEGTVVSFQTLQRKRRKAAEAAAELIG